MKRKVRRIAGNLAERLSHVEGVQAVLLGEAADIEVFDPYFTIDLDVYTAGAPPSIEARSTLLPGMDAFETSPVAAVDRFLLEELPASIHYIRSADVDRMLFRIAEQTWVFHEPGTNALYRIERGEVLFQRGTWLEESTGGPRPRAHAVLVAGAAACVLPGRARAVRPGRGGAPGRQPLLSRVLLPVGALRGKLPLCREPEVRAVGPHAC